MTDVLYRSRVKGGWDVGLKTDSGAIVNMHSHTAPVGAVLQQLMDRAEAMTSPIVKPEPRPRPKD